MKLSDESDSLHQIDSADDINEVVTAEETLLRLLLSVAFLLVVLVALHAHFAQQAAQVASAH